jgi:hypothetical protein
VSQNGPPGVQYQNFFDVFNLLAFVTPRAQSQEDVTRNADQAACIKLTSDQMTAMAAMNTEIPAQFAGKTCTNCDHLFGALQTYDDWDRNDGQLRVKNTIRMALQSKVPQLDQQILNLSSTISSFSPLRRTFLLMPIKPLGACLRLCLTYTQISSR